MELGLFRTSDATWHVLWVFSYRLLDGWSINRVLAEAFERYAGRLSPGSPSQPRLPYRDFIASLPKDHAASHEHFQRLLGGAPLLCQHSVTRLSRGAGSSLPSGTYFKRRREIGQAESECLKGFARDHRLTLSTLFFGAWAVRLASIGSAPDVTFGVTVSGRSAGTPGIDAMVGTAIHMLPLSVTLDPRKRVVEFLSALQETQAELSQHEHASPAAVRGGRGARDGPPFTSYLVFENFPVDPAFFANAHRWQIGDFEDLVQTEHPLRIEVFPGASMSVTMSTYSSLFDPPSLDGEIVQLIGLVSRLAADGNAPLSAFVKKPSRAKGGRVPPERRTVSLGAKRSASPEGASPKDGTSNRSVS